MTEVFSRPLVTKDDVVSRLKAALEKVAPAWAMRAEKRIIHLIVSRMKAADAGGRFFLLDGELAAIIHEELAKEN